MRDEQPIPFWQKLAAALYVVAGVVLVVAFSDRIGPDFWPLDASRVGPNLVAGVVVALIMTPIGVLIWPPTRRRIHRFVDRKVAPLHSRIDELHAKHERTLEHLEALRESHDALHSKLDALNSPED